VTAATAPHTRGTSPGLLVALAAVLATLVGLVTLVVPGPARAADGVPPGGAWVRVGHFVPGMSKARVTLEPADPGGSSTPMGEIDYGTVSGYRQLTPGTYTATVSGATDEDSGDAAPVLSSSFEVAAGDARTVAVVGTSAQPRLTLLDDDLAPPDPGTARVRLLSASERAGAVTVRAQDGPTVAQDAVLGQATPYATVPAGDWTLTVSGAATPADSDETRQRVDVASGSVYTVVVVDAPAGGVELDVVTDAAGASVTPRGGADTGGGGTAPAGIAARWAAALHALF